MCIIFKLFPFGNQASFYVAKSMLSLVYAPYLSEGAIKERQNRINKQKGIDNVDNL